MIDSSTPTITIESGIFDKIKIPDYVLNEQITCAGELISLSQKEKEINPKKMIQLGDPLFELKKRKDQVIALSSNSSVPKLWHFEEKNMPDTHISLGIDMLVSKNQMYTQELISILSPHGMAVRKFVEILNDENVKILDLLATLALVVGYERGIACGTIKKEKAPQKIICLAKHINIKKHRDVLHVFNLSGGIYINGLIDSISIIDTCISVPMVTSFSEKAG